MEVHTMLRLRIPLANVENKALDELLQSYQSVST